MKVKHLITELQKIDGDARVFMGYDGNIVVTEPDAVEYIKEENQIGSCWFRINIGDVVILCDKS